MKQSVLIVEDDPQIAAVLEQSVQELQFTAEHISNGRRALDRALSGEHALVLLDVTLPGLDGFEICRMVRAQHPALPILLVTSRTREEDRVLGLNLGADDYILKPFSTRELQARIRAILRRAAHVAPEPQLSRVIDAGDIHLDPEHYLVKIGGTAIDLTTLEFDLLYHLARNPEKIHSREELMRSLWGYESAEFAESITTYFSRLRAKIEKDPKKPKYIRTVHGKGYRFIAGEAATHEP